MKYRQTDIQTQNSGRSNERASTEGNPALNVLQHLPRPVYGSADSLPNQAIPQWHSHAWVQLSHVATGVIHVDTMEGCFLVPPYRAVLIPANVEHAVRCSPLTVIRSLYIDPEAISVEGSSCRVIKVTPLLRELICSFSQFPIEYEELGTQGRLTHVLLDQLSAAPVTNLKLPWPRDERLSKLCRTLREQPDKRDSLLQYSQQLGVSEKTLSRLFRQQTGLSFRQWRQRCRVLNALPGLERGERVTDIALSCGYDSMSAFIAAFREQLGVTPGEFFREPTASPRF